MKSINYPMIDRSTDRPTKKKNTSKDSHHPFAFVILLEDGFIVTLLIFFYPLFLRRVLFFSLSLSLMLYG